jgi:hypothetical protein
VTALRPLAALLHTIVLPLVACAAVTAAGPRSARAAGVAAPDDTTCTYARCALALDPAWNGLVLVRGEARRPVASLGFFWPGDIAPVFAGADRAHDFAKRAVRVRRAGAALTDLGGLLLALAAIGAITDDAHPGRYPAVAGAGAASLAISVPLQFSADGHLSRAVWWYNARFAR